MRTSFKIRSPALAEDDPSTTSKRASRSDQCNILACLIHALIGGAAAVAFKARCCESEESADGAAVQVAAPVAFSE
jgi:hypothetical protein